MKHKRLALIILFSLVLQVHFVYSQTVEYTSSFFAASSDTAKYFVFIYKDYLNILRMDNRQQWTKVKFNYSNIDKCYEILVFQDELLILDRPDVMSVYDLNAMCSSANNNKEISQRDYRPGWIENVKKLTFSDNKLFYLKSNDKAIYEYMGKAQERNTGISVSSTDIVSFMIYHPFSEQRKNDFSSSEKKVIDNIANLTIVPDQKFKNNIISDLNSLSDPNRSKLKIFELSRNRLGVNLDQQKQAYSDYLFLYALTGSRNQKINLAPLQRIADERNVDDSIKSYYIIPGELERLNSPQEKANREQSVRDKYNSDVASEKNKMQSKYGSDFEALYTRFNNFENNNKNNVWVESNRRSRQNLNDEFKQNLPKINNFQGALANFIGDEFGNYQSQEYKDFYELFTALSDKYDQYNDDVVRGILRIGKMVSDAQVNAKDSYMTAYLKKAGKNQSTFSVFKADYETYTNTTLPNLEKDRDDKLKKISDSIQEEIKIKTAAWYKSVDDISLYVQYKFLGEIAYKAFNDIQINFKLTNPNYNYQLLDFSIIQGNAINNAAADRVVFGYTINTNINFGQLTVQTNTNSNNPSYPYPQLYTNMLKNKNIMLLMSSRTAFTIYKMDDIDIMKNPETIAPNGDVFYIIQSNNFIYYISVKGELNRIGFSNGALKHEQLPNRINDGDKVYIASRKDGTDVISVISSDGKINGNASGKIQINSRNRSEDIFTLNIVSNNISVEAR